MLAGFNDTPEHFNFQTSIDANDDLVVTASAPSPIEPATVEDDDRLEPAGGDATATGTVDTGDVDIGVGRSPDTGGANNNRSVAS